MLNLGSFRSEVKSIHCSKDNMNLPLNLILVNKSFTTDSNVTFQHLDRYNNTIGENNLRVAFLVIVLCSFIVFGILLGTILTHIFFVHLVFNSHTFWVWEKSACSKFVWGKSQVNNIRQIVNTYIARLCWFLHSCWYLLIYQNSTQLKQF